MLLQKQFCFQANLNDFGGHLQSVNDLIREDKRVQNFTEINMKTF